MADVTESEDLVSLAEDMRIWRRHLHENPEFGFEEKETARFVAETLRRSGLTDIAEGIGGTFPRMLPSSYINLVLSFDVRACSSLIVILAIYTPKFAPYYCEAFAVY